MGFLLAAAPHHLSDAQIGLFALIGVVGALGAHVAGRLADRGRAHRATGAFLGVTALSLAPIAAGSTSLIALAAGLILFDFGVQATHISNQTVVYRLHPHQRSRLNTAYMTSYFVGGATGSGCSAVAVRALWMDRGVLARRGVPAFAGLLLWSREAVRRRRPARPGAAHGPARRAGMPGRVLSP